MAESGGRGTSGRLRSPDSADSSAGQRERENPGIEGHSFIFCPSRRARLHGSAAPLSLSRLRRCLPRLARGRGGARGGAGARSARRAWGKGSWPCAPSSACSTEAPPPASQPLSELGDLSRPPLLTSLPTRPHPSFLSAPPPPATVGVGQRRRKLERGGRRAASLGGRRGSRKRNFSLPPPACGPQPVPPPVPRGWGLHLRPGRELRPRLWEDVGSGGGRVTCIGGSVFPSASLLPGARVRGQPATGVPIPISHQPVAGRFAASSGG